MVIYVLYEGFRDILLPIMGNQMGKKSENEMEKSATLTLNPGHVILFSSRLMRFRYGEAALPSSSARLDKQQDSLEDGQQ